MPDMTTTHEYKIGYCRVSSASQNLDSQLDALKAAGCQQIYSDKISGTTLSRPEWDKLLATLRKGDILVITELSRMTRGVVHLLQTVSLLEEKEVQLISLRENLDTKSATGRAFIGMMGVINQLEKDLKSERAAAGRLSAKARGRTGGRPRTDQGKLEQAKIIYENSDKTAAEVCATFGLKRRTLFNYLKDTKVTSESVAGSGSA
jgi:DNA invertase Pin-like site-specific DNA recombinase